VGELLFEKTDRVATITLNRPERYNAISGPMLAAFSEALVESDQDTSIRVIIITGAGRGFCSGLDLQEQAAGSGIAKGDGIGGMTQRFDLRDAPPTVLHTTDKPTICALNGPAAGYGMDLALGCDMRVASDTGALAAAFTKRGVLPESGGTWLLPRLVGWAKASEIFFTGRKLDAQQCLEMGLVNQVVPGAELMDEVNKLAAEIADNAPLSVQATKRMMRMGLEESFEANVHHVLLQLLPLIRSNDFREGLTAYMEKRKPEFTGR
jgi:enoyl-CoA hydratase/carnithine racemase